MEKQNSQVGKEIELPSGAVAVVKTRLKGRHIMKAQAMIDGDQSKFIFAMIQQAVEVNGESLTMEDIEEMDWEDVLELMSVFGGSFQSAQVK